MSIISVPIAIGDIRDVLLREIVRGRRQSLSSTTAGAPAGASLGGPISPRERRLPKRLPGRSPSPEGGPVGLNLLPMCQVSSVSAGPTTAGSRGSRGGPALRNSFSGGGGPRGGARDDRQSEMPSETGAAGGSRPSRGASKRRRELSLLGRSGRGPSLLQGLANLGSSSPKPPPKPERSFAIPQCVNGV